MGKSMSVGVFVSGHSFRCSFDQSKRQFF